ncbi:MAG: hypothetical protein AAGD11_15635 [Planctomycetota bacterium]
MPTRCYNQGMSHYLRIRSGQIYFFTVVTAHCQPILTTDLGRSNLRMSFRSAYEIGPGRRFTVTLGKVNTR